MCVMCVRVCAYVRVCSVWAFVHVCVCVCLACFRVRVCVLMLSSFYCLVYMLIHTPTLTSTHMQTHTHIPSGKSSAADTIRRPQHQNLRRTLGLCAQTRTQQWYARTKFPCIHTYTNSFTPFAFIHILTHSAHTHTRHNTRTHTLHNTTYTQDFLGYTKVSGAHSCSAHSSAYTSLRMRCTRGQHTPHTHTHTHTHNIHSTLYTTHILSSHTYYKHIDQRILCFL